MRVRFRDTDVQGHVYFGSYFEFCDEALSAYMRVLGVPWQALVERGIDLFYAHATCDYRGSARFEDVIRIEVSIVGVGNTSFTSDFVVRSDDGEALANARLVTVCVDKETRAKTRVPDDLRTAVAPLQGA